MAVAWRSHAWELLRSGAAAGGACPWIEVIKRSICIEGARTAFTRAKVHWGRLDAENLMKDGPPARKGHRKPENYYKDVMKGARLMANECTKDVIFE